MTRTTALQPPKNLRRADPRCCLTCRNRENAADGAPVCTRDDTPRCDEPERLVCDRWKSRLFTHTTKEMQDDQ